MSKLHRYLSSIGLALAYSMSSQATPQVDAVSGSFTQNGTLTIRGSAFSTKAQAKPLFFWEADGGEEPSALGRKLTWDAAFNGEIVNIGDSGVEVAPGSDKSARLDYGPNRGAILARLTFTSDELYIWRKRRDDFHPDDAYAIRTRYTGLRSTPAGDAAGGSVQVGMLMATADKFVTGKIQEVNESTATEGSYYFDNDVGSLADMSVGSQVANNETLYIYAAADTSFTTPLFLYESAEGAGLFYTFNHKTIRFWGDYPTGKNNTYIGLGTDAASVASGGAMVSEYTQVETYWERDWDVSIQAPGYRWAQEEYQYSAGSIDIADGRLEFWQDGIRAWPESKRFRFRTSTWPDKYSDLYQNQVSNGAQPGTYEYFDALYVDDTHHRVIICDSPTYSTCSNPEVQIPKTWSETEITISARLKAFRNVADSDKVSFQDLYLYVADENGNINEDGMNLCIDCIKAPAFSGKASAE